MTLKAIYQNGLWIITAVVAGEVREYAGKHICQAVRLLAADISYTTQVGEEEQT